ncbi:MAG: efflux RND transporter periplasmic adaptor subunit [Parachlamydiaceae bacterium]
MTNYFKDLKGVLIPVFAGCALTFAVYTVVFKPKSESKPPEILPSLSPYAKNIAGIGVIEPESELISIGTDLSGIVRIVQVKVGDYVRQSDPLFALDQREIDAQIEILKANLQTAEIQSQDAHSQFRFAQNVRDQRAISQEELSRRKYAYEFALKKVDEVRALLEQAITNKDRLTVRAPIDGEILEVNIRPGEFAVAGAGNLPLIRMGNTSILHVRVEFDEENASSVNSQSLATGFVRGKAEKPIPIKFVRFEKYVKPKQNLTISGQRIDTRVLQIIYALPKDVKNLFVGQQMDVFVEQTPVDLGANLSIDSEAV